MALNPTVDALERMLLRQELSLDDMEKCVCCNKDHLLLLIANRGGGGVVSGSKGSLLRNAYELLAQLNPVPALPVNHAQLQPPPAVVPAEEAEEAGLGESEREELARLKVEAVVAAAVAPNPP